MNPDPVSVNTSEPTGTVAKRPRLVMQDGNETHPHTVYAFPPNRETLGGTAYLIVDEANILIDCPAWDDANRAFLEAQGGVDWLFLTHRGGIANVREMQQAFNCQVVIQEQEAYLLPGLEVTAFERSFDFDPGIRAIWTSGHSPGSACLYYDQLGGVLFSGRHLLPTPQGTLMPIKTAKTFHWRRQIRNVQMLLDTLNPDTLEWICPGANTGFLRGKYAISQAYSQLSAIDLTSLCD